MTKKEVQKIVNEVYPKIEKHYGISKFQECTPYVELHRNIYEKYSGEEGMEGDENDCHAEFCDMLNEITIYYPNMKDREMVIKSLVHEYQHHLQSPIWFKRYYNMGHNYTTHPYEVDATSKEKEWVLFN
tara:strand:+ start:98 stop:484 length:387 start_codon:yes stop_codon:yes gene_type:complete